MHQAQAETTMSELPAARRGEWPEIAAPKNAPHLLEDDPGAQPDLEGLFEQDKVTEELFGFIAGFLDRLAGSGNFLNHEVYGPSPGKNRVIALHGRYGQGKSRIIATLKNALDKRRLVGRRRRPCVRVQEFQCSSYSPDDLLFNFDHFLERGKAIRMLGLALFLSIIVYALASVPTIDEGLEAVNVGKFFVTATTFLATVFASYRHLLRDALRQLRIDRAILEILSDIIDHMFNKPDVLIIDDLDRASPDQQTALLNSLQRHARDFCGVVVVVFDDAPLFEALETREKAGEFITKVFHASFRLAPMNARDAGMMAFGYCRELRERNPQCLYAKKIFQPIVCGAMARVFLLHGTASARFSKKLVNNVYAAARVGQFTNEADIVALVRLHSIFQTVPQLESRLDVVAQSLLDTSDDRMVNHIAARIDGQISEAQQTRLTEFMARTPHMQPAGLHWLQILRAWRRGPSRAPDIAPPEEWPENWTRHWALNDALLASTRDPQERLSLYRDLVRFPFAPSAHPELKARNSIKHRSQHRLPTEAETEYWNALVAQLHAFDDEVLMLETDDEVAELLAEHRNQPLGTLFYSNRAGIALAGIEAVFRHVLHVSDGLLEERFKHELGILLGSSQPKRVIEAPVLQNARIGEFEPNTLKDTWPPFPVNPNEDPSAKIAKHHFSRFGQLLRELNRFTPILPNAHQRWLRYNARQRHFDNIDDAIASLLGLNDEEIQPIWHEGFVTELWRTLGEDEGFLQHLVARARPPFQSFISIWLLAQYPQPERITDALSEIDELPEPIFPEIAEANGRPPEWYEPIARLSEQWDTLARALARWEANQTSNC